VSVHCSVSGSVDLGSGEVLKSPSPSPSREQHLAGRKTYGGSEAKRSVSEPVAAKCRDGIEELARTRDQECLARVEENQVEAV